MGVRRVRTLANRRQSFSTLVCLTKRSVRVQEEAGLERDVRKSSVIGGKKWKIRCLCRTVNITDN